MVSSTTCFILQGAVKTALDDQSDVISQICATVTQTLLVAPAGCADLNSLDSLSPQEKKRQGYIHELIDSEDRYVTDLQIVLEVTDVSS